MKTLKEEIIELLAANRDRRVEDLKKQWRGSCLFAARNGRLSCLLPDSDKEFDWASEWAMGEGFRVGGNKEGVIVFFEFGSSDEGEISQ
jgi:hypothetical protein